VSRRGPRKESTPNDRLAADREAALRLVRVSRETLARLDAFVALLQKWQRKINLIGRGTEDSLWTRHIADSLQLLDLAPAARTWVDLGSGGGFPGLVIACALAERPGARVHLVESNTRKAAFLREAARNLRLPALVHAERIEDFVSNFADSPDVVTARALASLEDLLAYAAPLMENGAQALFLKGQDVEAELTEAAKSWNIQADLVPSRTDRGGRIVVVKGPPPIE
jgi:16S rRNA (guanine527-N7)-methyltransferase